MMPICLEFDLDFLDNRVVITILLCQLFCIGGIYWNHDASSSCYDLERLRRESLGRLLSSSRPLSRSLSLYLSRCPSLDLCLSRDLSRSCRLGDLDLLLRCDRGDLERRLSRLFSSLRSCRNSSSRSSWYFFRSCLISRTFAAPRFIIARGSLADMRCAARSFRRGSSFPNTSLAGSCAATLTSESDLEYHGFDVPCRPVAFVNRIWYWSSYSRFFFCASPSASSFFSTRDCAPNKSILPAWSTMGAELVFCRSNSALFSPALACSLATRSSNSVSSSPARFRCLFAPLGRHWEPESLTTACSCSCESSMGGGVSPRNIANRR